MYDDYYQLLGVPADKPDWALDNALEDIAKTIVEVYGDSPPHHLSVGLAVLGHPARRVQYVRLLELSALTSCNLDAQEYEELDALASLTHFEVGMLASMEFAVKNLGVDKQPMAQRRRERAFNSSEPEPNPAPKPQSTPEPTSSIDYAAYGCVNGSIPPLILGERVYEWSFAKCYLKHATRMKYSVHLTWQETIDGEEVREFAQQDYLGVCSPDEWYIPGCPYHHVILTDTLTRERYTAAFITADSNRGSYFLISSCGLYLYFPWPSKFCGSDSEPRRMPSAPFNHFGVSPKGSMNKTMERMVVTYMDAVHYWGVCHAMEFSEPLDFVRKEANGWTARALRLACAFSDRKIRKYGYTPLKA